MADNGFKRILVAFDGSADAVKAVRRASALSKEFNATLTIVHVYSLSVFAYAGPGPMPQLDFKALAESAKSNAQGIIDRGKTIAREEGVSAVGELLESSSVVQAIVEFAANEKFDLIVMGTRGMTGFKKLLLGSVSSGVASHAQCCVLVVR